MKQLKCYKILTGGGKLIWINHARAIAIICMVLCHTNDILGCNYSCYKWVGIFFMPLFFFISGCLSKDDISLRQLMNRLVGRLLIPYFVWGVIMQICINYSFIQACINGDDDTIRRNIIEILNGEYLWYVPCLVCIEIINFLIMKMSKRIHNIYIIRIIAILTSFVFLLLISEGHLPWHLDTAIASIGFYLLGFFFFRYGSYPKSAILSIILLTIFILVSIAERDYGVVFDIHKHILSHPVLILASSIIGIAVMTNFCLNFNLGQSLSLIGTNSLFIYIFHYKVLCLMKPIMNKVMAMTEIDISIIMIPIMVLISISACNMLIKPINKYAPILIGNKKLNI